MVACIPSWYRGRKSEFSPNFKGPSDKAGGQGHAGTLLSPSPPPGRRQGAPTLLSTNPSPRSLPNRRYHRCRPRWRWAPDAKGCLGGGGCSGWCTGVARAVPVWFVEMVVREAAPMSFSRRRWRPTLDLGYRRDLSLLWLLALWQRGWGLARNWSAQFGGAPSSYELGRCGCRWKPSSDSDHGGRWRCIYVVALLKASSKQTSSSRQGYSRGNPRSFLDWMMAAFSASLSSMGVLF
jgi:hypothetical protein